MLAATTVSSSKHTPKDEEVPIRLFCPWSNGQLCTWTAAHGWHLFWKPPDEGPPLLAFVQTASGRVVAMTLGHMGDSEVYVLDDRGRELLARRLPNQGHPLKDIIGESSTGDLVLCGGSGGLLCDLWLPTKAGVRKAPEFPKGCSIPRFLAGRALTCLDDSDGYILLTSGEHGWDRSELGIPVSDLLPLTDDTFVVEGVGWLFSWHRGSRVVKKLATNPVGWVGMVGGSLLFSDCRVGEEGVVFDCALKRISASLDIETLWNSGTFEVSRVLSSSPRIFVVESYGHGYRKLIRLKRSSNVWHAEQLWIGQVVRQKIVPNESPK
jgi:hypothetical protein